MNYIPQKIEFVQRYLNKIYNIKNLTNNVNEKYEFEFDKLNFLNKWIVVKFNNFLKSYTENFNNYKLTTAADMILNFS
jgi:valyl-tRNA synthetase